MNGLVLDPGCSDGERPRLTMGSGSTRRSAGVPCFMKLETCVISSCVNEEGSVTSKPSTSSVIGPEGAICTTSYCFRSSSTTAHDGELCIVWKSRPPKSLSCVVMTPTFFRSVLATTRMLRAISYSAGRPRSKNGITCSSPAHVKARPRKTSLKPARAP